MAASAFLWIEQEQRIAGARAHDRSREFQQQSMPNVNDVKNIVNPNISFVSFNSMALTSSSSAEKQSIFAILFSPLNG